MDAYLYDAVRTPRGKARADGGLACFTPQELVAHLHRAIGERTSGSASRPDGLWLGCVGQVGAQGGHVALVSKLHAGLPDAMPAWTVNNYCVSSLTAIGQAALLASQRPGARFLAGGVEMMSRVPFMADKADYYTDASFPLRTRYVPVAIAADRLAGKEGIGRATMDTLCARSHQRAAAAESTPALIRSRIAIQGEGGAGLARDECVRAQTTLESLAAMKPAFGELAAAYADALGHQAIDHRHTIAHAPPVCDGASLALVGARDAASVRPRARILGYAETGGDPFDSLLAGFSAMDRALEQARLTLADIERIEFMEAFAVTIAKFLRDRAVDPERVNVSGGHMAKGHPMGASGGILLSTLLDTLDAADATLGLVVASGASGVGAAMVVERLS